MNGTAQSSNGEDDSNTSHDNDANSHALNKTKLLITKISPSMLALALLLLIFGASKAIFEYNQNANLLQDKVSSLNSQIALVATDLDQSFSSISSNVLNIANKMNGTGRYTPAIKSQLAEVLNNDNNLYEIGIGFHKQNPNTDVVKGDAPHYGYKSHKRKHFDLNYNYWQVSWFKSVMAEGAHWYDPYFGSTTKKLVVGFGAPFSYQVNHKKVRGVVRANLSLDGTKNLLNSLQLGESGYTMLISSKNVFIAHPQTQYLNTSIDKVLTQTDHEKDESGVEHDFYLQLKDLLKNTDSPTSDSAISILDPLSSQPATLVIAEIGDTGMTLISIFLNDEFITSGEDDDQYKHILNLVLVASGILLLAIWYGLRSFSVLNKNILWPVSVFCSLILLTTLLFMSHLFYKAQVQDNLDIITSNTMLEGIVDQVHANSSGDIQKVPTGVFIQSIEFQTANNVFITGYIWQKAKDCSKVPGIIFPEAVAGSELQEAYCKDAKDHVNADGSIEKVKIKGWYFETTFRQPFDFTRYPLDDKDVWIRLWPESMDNNILLTPDLDAYTIHHKKLLPGIETSMVLSGWETESSGFFYLQNPYNSSFGMALDKSFGLHPELYFLIKLKRTFMDAFITNLVPLIVVAFMLFAMLLTISCDPDKAELFGSDPFSVVTASAGLFFVILLSHIQIRGEFPIPNIIYMEYFYLVMYMAILWVSVAAFRITLANEGELLHYKNGIVAKIMFWPLILIFLNVATYLVFS